MKLLHACCKRALFPVQFSKIFKGNPLEKLSTLVVALSVTKKKKILHFQRIPLRELGNEANISSVELTLIFRCMYDGFSSRSNTST